MPAPASAPAQSQPMVRAALAWRHHLHEWWWLWWNMLYLGSAMLVLVSYPSSHGRGTWQTIATRVYVRIRWSLLVFTVIAATIGAVLTQIVQQALSAFGLASLTPALMIRILLVEVVPLAAALVAAIKLTIPLGAELSTLRRQRQFVRLAKAHVDALRVEFLPRLLMGVYAAIMLAVFGSGVVLATIYLGTYGYTTAGIEAFTHTFGRTMTPFFTLVFGIKAIAFGYVVALIPLTTAYTDPRYGLRRESELITLARMLTLLMLVEVLSLIVNYY